MIFICAAIFKFLEWKRKKRAETLSNSTTAAGTPPDGDVEKQEKAEEPPGQVDAAAPHLTVLSRVGSRLSDTAGIGTWTIADNTGLREGHQHLGVGELEIGDMETVEKGQAGHKEQ